MAAGRRRTRLAAACGRRVLRPDRLGLRRSRRHPGVRLGIPSRAVLRVLGRRHLVAPRVDQRARDALAAQHAVAGPLRAVPRRNQPGVPARRVGGQAVELVPVDARDLPREGRADAGQIEEVSRRVGLSLRIAVQAAAQTVRRRIVRLAVVAPLRRSEIGRDRIGELRRRLGHPDLGLGPRGRVQRCDVRADQRRVAVRRGPVVEIRGSAQILVWM